jgi:hypothetical protein
MARNILAVWNGDRARMAEQARVNALQFSWDSSMEALFSTVYPAALAARTRDAFAASTEPALAA